METKLPLEDEKAYNDVVKNIVESNLKIRAEQNGSNKLGEAIRKAVLLPFHFLAEDPALHSCRPKSYKRSSREMDDQTLMDTHPTNPAASALILLRNSSEQSVKRARVDSGSTNQFRGATLCCNVTSSPNSFHTENDGTSAAELLQQNQLQRESSRQLISPTTLGTTSVERNASQLAVGQVYNTNINAVSGISDLDPYQPPSDNCSQLMQHVFSVTGESLEVTSHNGATYDSEEPFVLSDTNVSCAMSSQWDKWLDSGATAFCSQWDVWNPGTESLNFEEDDFSPSHLK